MTEKENIIENLKRLHEGNAWHGPSIREALRDVSAEKAARQVDGLHTIWGLVLHIGAWEEVFTLRLEGQAKNQPDEGDFPPVRETSPEAWKSALEYLETAHQELIQTISELPDSKLGETVPGKDYSVRFMLVGIIQHHVYHTGQISLLKKFQ